MMHRFLMPICLLVAALFLLLQSREISRVASLYRDAIAQCPAGSVYLQSQIERNI